MPGTVTVDLAALRWNYRLLTALAAPARCGAVVKADAYGLGSSRIGPILFEEGCREFFVAQLLEAQTLQECLPNGAKIFILGGILPGGERFAAESGFIPVLNSLEQLRRWYTTAAEDGRPLPAALQIDTGMSRLGFSPDELIMLRRDASWMDRIHVELVLSQLASGGIPSSGQNRDQLAALLSLSKQFEGAPLSLANSAGIMLGKDFLFSMTRPGIALYGVNPEHQMPNPLRPVVRLDVRVIQTREISPGTKVGYDATYTAKKAMNLATIAAGYGDGLPRTLSSRGAAFFEGIRLPIVGRVSMDSINLDVSALKAPAVGLGSLVELIGDHQSIEQLAADAGTISNEILTNLGNRYSRVYV
ncbi:alanine racemase [Agrobacterium rhizogenes]|nr:alanine racemase [Rhizobium rhizogenes]